ncbi:MAG: flagellar assembly protein FliH [Bacteroidia bacterium]
MSDKGETVQLWEAPFFEQPVASSAPPVASAEQEAIAQARAFLVGKEEGLEAGRAEAQEIVRSLAALVDEMALPFRGLDALVTKELAQLAMRLAEQIVRRELTIDSSVVTDIVAEAMETLYKLGDEIVVFLNPADAALVREFAPESLDGKSWKVVEDAGLLPGGCQVKTPTSFVDASVEKQIEEVFSTLLNSCDRELDS